MKSAIVSIIPSLTSSWRSHMGGVPRIFSAQLTAAGIEHDVLWHSGPQPVDWNAYDRIYLWQGLDMNGKLAMNLFGSQFPRYAERLRTFAGFEGEVVPMLYDCYPYHQLKTRNWRTTATVPNWDSGMLPSVWLNIEDAMDHAKPACLEPTHSIWYTIGDSHAPSVWQPNTNLRIHSGVTLHRVLEEGLRSWIPDDARRVTLYFGQIDLRHHLMRQPDPFEATAKLAVRLITQAVDLDIPVEFCTLHPVESEDRKIPGPGCYKGTPYFGSAEERTHVRWTFNQLLLDQIHNQVPGTGLSVYDYPPDWVDADGFMDQRFMEQGGSVHIAPEHYRAFRKS